MNVVVFDGVTPWIAKVMRRVEQEGRAWWNVGLLKGNVEGFFAQLSAWNRRE